MFPTTATALLIAAHLWGAPACGTPIVAYADPADSPAADALAWTNPFDDSGALDCTIRLNRADRWLLNPSMKCTVIVHEWGHLTGHGHTLDPRNVMYPTAEHIFWACNAERPAPALRWLNRPVAPLPQYPVDHAYYDDARY